MGGGFLLQSIPLLNIISIFVPTLVHSNTVAVFSGKLNEIINVGYPAIKGLYFYYSFKTNLIMSTIGTSITACEPIQRALVQYFQTCPSTRRPQTPTLIWSNSPENKSGINTVIQPASGKKMTARLTYTQPVATTEVTTVSDCDKVCTATTEQGDTSVDYTIDCTDGLTVDRLIRLSDWNQSCKGENEIIMETLVNMLDGLIPAVAEKQAQELNPLIGNWSSDVPNSWTDINEFLEVETKYSGGTNNPQWFERVNAAKVMTGFCDRTFITGGIELWQAWRLLNVGCCTNDGLDALEILNQYGEVVVWDRYIQAEFGADISLMLQANSIQLLSATWNTDMLNLGGLVDLDFTYRNGFQTVIIDPISGIPVDLNIKEDCGVVHIVMTATTKTVGLPNDLYPAGHPLELVNFVTAINVEAP